MKAVHSNWQYTGSECASTGRATGSNHQIKADHTNMFREGQYYTARNKWNVNRQLHERAKTTKTQRNLHCVKDKRKNTNEYGQHQRREKFRSHGKVWKHGAEVSNGLLRYQPSCSLFIIIPLAHCESYYCHLRMSNVKRS